MDATWLKERFGITCIEDVLNPTSGLTLYEIFSMDMAASTGAIGFEVGFNLPEIVNGDNRLVVRIECRDIRRAEIKGALSFGSLSMNLGEMRGPYQLTVDEDSFNASILCDTIRIPGGYSYFDQSTDDGGVM